jgi:hypothetical protein
MEQLEEAAAMSIGLEASGRLVPALWRELCDKCSTRMELKGFGHGFERWACPFCHQVVGIDGLDGNMPGGHGWSWSYLPGDHRHHAHSGCDARPRSVSPAPMADSLEPCQCGRHVVGHGADPAVHRPGSPPQPDEPQQAVLIGSATLLDAAVREGIDLAGEDPDERTSHPPSTIFGPGW